MKGNILNLALSSEFDFIFPRLCLNFGQILFIVYTFLKEASTFKYNWSLSRSSSSRFLKILMNDSIFLLKKGIFEATKKVKFFEEDPRERKLFTHGHYPHQLVAAAKERVVTYCKLVVNSTYHVKHLFAQIREDVPYVEIVDLVAEMLVLFMSILVGGLWRIAAKQSVEGTLTTNSILSLVVEAFVALSQNNSFVSACASTKYTQSFLDARTYIRKYFAKDKADQVKCFEEFVTKLDGLRMESRSRSIPEILPSQLRCNDESKDSTAMLSDRAISPNQSFQMSEHYELRSQEEGFSDYEDFLLSSSLFTDIEDLPQDAQRSILVGGAVLFYCKWESKKAIEDLNRCIELYQNVFPLIQEGKHAGSLICFLSALICRYQLTMSLDDLNLAIKVGDTIMNENIEKFPSQCENCLQKLAGASEERFRRTLCINDLDRVIWAYKGLIDFSTIDSNDRIRYLGLYGMSLLKRYGLTGSQSDITPAVEALQKAIDAMPNGNLSSEQIELLHCLALALQHKSNECKSCDDLDRAIQIHERLLALDSDKSLGGKSAFLIALGLSLQRRFERSGMREDLDRAIKLFEDGIERACNASIRSTLFGCLGNALQVLFEQTGVIADIDRSIEMTEQGLNSLPTTDPERPARLANLGDALRKRFEENGSLNDLERSVVTIKQALALATTNDQDRSYHFSALGTSLQRLYELNGSIEDLEAAITAKEQAIDLTTENNFQRPGCLMNLANSLIHRFERHGAIADLNKSVSLYREAVSMVPIGHPERSLALSNLARSLDVRFIHKGEWSDLDEAMVLLQKALDMIPLTHPSRSDYLTSLGIVLSGRFRHFGAMEDLERALEISEEASRLMPKSHPRKADCLNNYGSILLEHFQRTGSLESLDRSIYLLRDAIALASRSCSTQARILSNLGIAFEHRYMLTRSKQYLEEVLKMHEQALALTKPDQLRYPAYLHNLSISWHLLFKQEGSIESLNRAIAIGERAIELTAVGHPSLAGYLTNVSDLLGERYEATNNIKDHTKAVHLGKQAAESVSAPPFIRILVSISVSNLLLNREPAQACFHLTNAVHLLPLLGTRTLASKDFQHRISKFDGLTALATSLNLSCGEVAFKALELMELGRGILAGMKLDIRSDITALQEKYPHHYDRFRFLRNAIELPSIEEGGWGSESRHTEDRVNFSRELDQLISHIRQKDGFTRFLLGPSESEMTSLASCGSIVIFNISHVRSDAILLQKHGVWSIALPLLLYSDLKIYTEKFRNATSVNCRSYHNAKREMTQVLEWLWNVAVEPILDALGITEAPAKIQTGQESGGLVAGF